jgi:hypothetical protein
MNGFYKWKCATDPSFDADEDDLSDWGYNGDERTT